MPPAIEFGISESGQLAVASAPELPDASREQQAPLRLAMDLATLDTESVVLGAAAANARVQLGEALRTITDSKALPESPAGSPQQQQSATAACKLRSTVLPSASAMHWQRSPSATLAHISMVVACASMHIISSSVRTLDKTQVLCKRACPGVRSCKPTMGQQSCVTRSPQQQPRRRRMRLHQGPQPPRRALSWRSAAAARPSWRSACTSGEAACSSGFLRPTARG